MLDKKTYTPEQIAKKHKVPLSVIEKQLKLGMEIEKEHTSSGKTAREIALDHLLELPNYYSKLKKVEETNMPDKTKTLQDRLSALKKKKRDPHHVVVRDSENGNPAVELIKKKETVQTEMVATMKRILQKARKKKPVTGRGGSVDKPVDPGNASSRPLTPVQQRHRDSGGPQTPSRSQKMRARYESAGDVYAAFITEQMGAHGRSMVSSGTDFIGKNKDK